MIGGQRVHLSQMCRKLKLAQKKVTLLIIDWYVQIWIEQRQFDWKLKVKYKKTLVAQTTG